MWLIMICMSRWVFCSVCMLIILYYSPCHVAHRDLKVYVDHSVLQSMKYGSSSRVCLVESFVLLIMMTYSPCRLVLGSLFQVYVYRGIFFLFLSYSPCQASLLKMSISREVLSCKIISVLESMSRVSSQGYCLSWSFVLCLSSILSTVQTMMLLQAS